LRRLILDLVLEMPQPEVRVERRGNGDLVLSNPIPIASYPKNLVSWLHEHAARQPGKQFLGERDSTRRMRSITYSEMAKKVNQVSNGLLGLSLPPNAPIALLSHNCIEMAIATFAAMQIGHPVVPISLAYSTRSRTGELVNHVLAETDAPVLVMSDAELHMPKLQQWDRAGRTRKLFAFRNSDFAEEVEPFDALVAVDAELSPAARTRFDEVTADTLAKIQFTSGSTDLPKGVEVTHGMMASNQVSVHQLWPFLDSDEVLCDWLPWNHTFGGNFVTNMALMHGATMHIDDGNPTPDGLERTVANIIDVRPTIYFGVPASYAALYTRLQADASLRRAFFGRLKFIFVAAAALDQPTYEGMKRMAKAERGADVPFLSAWGSTETAPGATLVYWLTQDVRVIGLPLPGTTLKLVPDEEPNRYQARVAGPNVTRGFYRDPDATAAAFDEEGYYRTGDALGFVDERDPSAGLVFSGRIGEDFKLSSGVWVRNASIRASIHALGKPYVTEVVLAAPNRPYLTALVIPNVAALRDVYPKESEANHDDPGFLGTEGVRACFRSVFQRHNEAETGSSRRITRFAILVEPPSFDRGEATDKGYINQRAVLRDNESLVSELYRETSSGRVSDVPS
jgi:feruloyl-CoA synthase